MSLKKELGLVELVLMGIGIIIGVGIYTLIGEAAVIAKNGIWFSFLLSSILAILTSISYSELSQLFPKAGAEYVYVKNSFGGIVSFVLAFLMIVGGCFAAATISVGFANYFSFFFPFPIVILALVLIAFCTFLNVHGIRESAIFAGAVSVIQVFGLFLIIFVGAGKFGSVNYFEFDLRGVFSGAALLFFAFLGFEGIPRLSEEVKDKKIIPKAMVISILISTIIYILVAISSVSLVSWEILANSKAPLSEVAKVGFGESASILISLIAIFATSSTVLVDLIFTSRIVYGLGDIFPTLKRVGKKGTPYFAAILVGVISAIFVFFENLRFLAGITNFTVFITFLLVNLSCIYLRKSGKIKEKYSPDLFGIPIFQIFTIAFSLLFILGFSVDVIVGGIALIIIGFIFYLIFVGSTQN
ncbi:MAG: APC family permease, partial [Candidatus Micrarchaeia archaeon]